MYECICIHIISLPIQNSGPVVMKKNLNLFLLYHKIKHLPDVKLH